MHYKSVFPLICLLSSGLVSLPQTDGAEPVSAESPKPSASSADLVSAHVKPLLTKYCFECHSGTKTKAGLDLTKVADDLSIIKDRKLWGRLAEYVEAGDMPPEGRPQPTQAEVEQMTRAIEEVLSNVDCGRETDPGRVTIRRLNRAEYNNTIRDLVGIDFHPADDFPSDDVGYGFDNIGDVLTLPPLLMEKYLAAAEAIAERAIVLTPAGARVGRPCPSRTGGSSSARRLPKTRGDCARAILERFASRAYRRPASAGEVGRLIRFVDLAAAERRELRAGHPARRAGGPGLAPVPLPGRARPRPGSSGDEAEAADASRSATSSWPRGSRISSGAACPTTSCSTLGPRREAARRAIPWSPGPADAPRPEGEGPRRELRRPVAPAPQPAKHVNPDTRQFPGFDDALRAAMLEETELFFEAIMREDRSVLDFLDADYTFVNERLAQHYGIPGVKGDEFRRVTLDDGRRGGLLTQASILTVTSNPTRTSPVKRGKWILEQILGTPPPPPPPDVPELKDDKDVELTGTLRQRMEQHRANPSCASCHARMDPLGFGFENFDAIGAWRDKDGELPDRRLGHAAVAARSFKGPKELKAILKTRDKEFSRCLPEKMLTYALGPRARILRPLRRRPDRRRTSRRTTTSSHGWCSRSSRATRSRSARAKGTDR